MPSEKWRWSKGWISVFSVAGVSLVAIFAALSYGRFFTDNINYFSYDPDLAVQSLAETTKMSDKGKFLFYASQPVLENADGFNEKCGRSEAKTAILGCYNGRTIHIYDIKDDRLAGIKETTAAHEMLHAAYDRLSRREKESVNGLLSNELKKLENDESLMERLAYYDRSEPGEQNNELHSIIGTEIAGVSADLESYYSRYFDERRLVVALRDKYESVFKALKEQAAALNSQLAQLNTVIKNDSVAYNEEALQVKGDISNFNQRAERGDFSSQAEFNAERRLLTKRVSDMETLRSTINANIEKYNALVIELNGIATQTEDLNRSIDSTLAPAPSL